MTVRIYNNKINPIEDKLNSLRIGVCAVFYSYRFSYIMDFIEQIKHPKWQKKRLKILERDKYSCQSCGSNEETLHVHHYFYLKNKLIWEYNDDVLVTLCEDCHKKWHEKKKQIDKTLALPTDYLDEILELLKIISINNPYQISLITESILIKHNGRS